VSYKVAKEEEVVLEKRLCKSVTRIVRTRARREKSGVKETGLKGVERKMERQ